MHNSVAILIATSLLFIISCDQLPSIKKENVVVDGLANRGKAIAAVWCASCHQLPEPSLLSKDLWRLKILPYMGLRLGFHSPAADSMVADITDSTIYPKQKLITDEEWKAIIHYYTSVAPDSMLPQPKQEAAQAAMGLFKPDFVYAENAKPGVCFVKIDTLQHPHQLVFADAFKKIFRLNSEYKMLDFLPVPGPIVDMNWTGENNIYTNIGTIDPGNEKLGNAGSIKMGADGRPVYQVLFEKFLRPVQSLPCDLNKDGNKDYIICEFGVDRGGVYWMENEGNNHYRKHILLGLSGAVKAVVTDANQDGLPDVYVLMAQGDESIYLFTNKGNGIFDSKRVLRFPAVYGSVSFELADFNKDGYLDILYSCGDNADVTPVLKPYHGIYIFMNDKAGQFIQSYFYPMYGCYKAMAADFNGDGKLDIAAISFFADYMHHPQDGFVYLQNTGNNHFKPYSIAETAKGRWLCMDVGDIDGDKKPDIVLGNMAAPVQGDDKPGRWANSAPVLVLKNIMK